MKKAYRNFVSLTLTLFLAAGIALALPACGEPPVPDVDTTAFLVTATDLLHRAELLNDVFLTDKGLPFVAEGFSSGNYKEVTTDVLPENFRTLDALLSEARAVFTEAALRQLDVMVQNPERTEGLPLAYARYITYKTVDEANENNGKILAYANRDEWFSDSVRFMLLTVDRVYYTRDGVPAVTVKCDVLVTRGEKSQTVRGLTYEFLEENGVWKMDTLPYLRIVES